MPRLRVRGSLSPESDDVQVGLGIVHLSFGDEADELQVTSLDSIGKNVVSTVIDTLQPHPSDSNSLYCTIGYKTGTGCGAKALKITLERVGGRNRISSASAFDIIENDPKVKSLNPWNKKNTLLAAVSTDEDVNSLDQTGYLALCATPDADQILAIENGSGSMGTFDKEVVCRMLVCRLPTPLESCLLLRCHLMPPSRCPQGRVG